VHEACGIFKDERRRATDSQVVEKVLDDGAPRIFNVVKPGVPVCPGDAAAIDCN